MAGNDNNVNAQTSNGTSTAWQIVGRLIAAAIIPMTPDITDDNILILVWVLKSIFLVKSILWIIPNAS